MVYFFFKILGHQKVFSITNTIVSHSKMVWETKSHFQKNNVFPRKIEFWYFQPTCWWKAKSFSSLNRCLHSAQLNTRYRVIIWWLPILTEDLRSQLLTTHHRGFLEHWNSQKSLCNIWQHFSCPKIFSDLSGLSMCISKRKKWI